MKTAQVFLVGLILGGFYFSELYSAISTGVFLSLLYRVVFESNNLFVFREWALMLYALNYLFAPAVTYNLDKSAVAYPMKLASDDYFFLMIPGFLLFSIGLYSLKTKIFTVDFTQFNLSVFGNDNFLIRLTQIGLGLRIFSFLFPGDLGFFVYLFSLVRYVGAFSLFAIDKKYWFWPAIILIQEMGSAFVVGMYHDAVMWVVFFAIFYVYVYKPTVGAKLLGLGCLLVFVLFIQGMKSVYRNAISEGGKEAGLSTAANLGADLIDEGGVLEENNLLGTLNRGNQAWILASTVDNMNRNQDFQGMENMKLYFKSALLPRFLAPDKLKSGNKEIFNKFSGHFINDNTSMGLGIFADGYIAYGAYGLWIFGYCLGLLFSLTFKLVERWARISPFYVLLLLPMLNYAVRPDCETQTTLNHLTKSILLYGIIVNLSKYRFKLKPESKFKKFHHLEIH